MSSKKPKLGTAIKKVTETVGIPTCSTCEARAFQMDRWTHRKPIRKIDVKDCEEWNNPDRLSNLEDLYIKYFGLDNTKTKSIRVLEIMQNDLNKLFNDAD